MTDLVGSIGSIVDAKVSFEATALFVTWAGVAFLAIVAMHLHLRLLRLERAAATASANRPYARLLGSRIDELLDGTSFQPTPRVVVTLSTTCKSCGRVLDEMASPDWTLPTVLLWTDQAPQSTPRLPANVVVPSNGSALAAKLGIRATPFALWMDKDGFVVKASPVASLGTSSASVDRAGLLEAAG